MFACFSLAAAATYHVSVTGSDTSGTGTSSNPWKTLKYACANVAADQGHTIQLGAGTFSDPDRFVYYNAATDKWIPPYVPAKLPRNVNLLGMGKTQTVYKGEIYVLAVKDQVIADFKMDGWENTNAATKYFRGLWIENRDNLEVRDMSIEGFYSDGLRFGQYAGLTNSSLHHCDLLNNGKYNSRGFGMRTGNMTNCEIHDNIFKEERGKGGEIWNTGPRTFTNVKVYNNSFSTHKDSAAGWNGQVVFNFEWVTTDCLNVEVYNNQFDGSISLVDPASPRTNKTPYSVRVHDNTWTYTKRYGIEVSMHYLEIDHNYFHFDKTTDIDQGGGNYALSGYGGVANYALIHHNTTEHVPNEFIHNLIGDNIEIYNNTITGAIEQGTHPLFMQISRTGSRNNWTIANNVFSCDPIKTGTFFSYSTYPMPGLQVLDNVMYNAVAGYTAGSGIETPLLADPVFTGTGNKPSPYYVPATGSPLIDAGSIIPGITDGYSGTAPDIGAYESTSLFVIATDDFESNSTSGGTGWTGVWIKAGTVYTVTPGSQGTYAAQIKNVGAIMTRSVNLSAYSNVEINVDLRTSSMEVGDAAYFEFYNGATWTTLKTLTLADSGWISYTFDLSALSMVGTNQQIRLRGGMNAAADYALIDAITIRGMP